MGAPRPDEPVRRLGNFEVLREIAEGGMGVVHLARQPELDRLVVLKRMRRDLSADPSMVARFEREARAAAAIQHHHVVAVHDCFRHRGDHWIAQEFVDGDDLERIQRRTGPIPAEVAARIAAGVAAGLEEVHARGIVHRDLKPANVLVGRGGEVKIADFGIAVERGGPGLTRPGTMLGSVPYMSPEQMMGEQVDYRTDVYAFGILLYRMVCGVPPFRESEEGAEDTLLERMQRGKYPSPKSHGVDVPRWMRRLIARCLQPKPATRFRSFTEIRLRLRRRSASVSPGDDRRTIAAWLNDRGAFEPLQDGTVVRPLEPVRSAARGAPAWRTRRSVAAVAAAIPLALVAGWALRPGRTDAPTEAALEVSTDARVADVRSESPAPDPPPGESPVSTVDPVDPEAPGTTEPETSPLPAPPPEPAQVRFVARPWARITVDDEKAFLTPRADPVRLSPGSHTVVFEHPTLGRVERVVDLVAGEERSLVHDFRAEDPT